MGVVGRVFRRCNKVLVAIMTVLSVVLIMATIVNSSTANVMKGAFDSLVAGFSGRTGVDIGWRIMRKT